MAIDYYITYSQKDKIALLQGITESIQTGQIIRVRTAQGKETEFSPKLDNYLVYQQLCYSIANSPDYDPNDAVQVACLGNARPGITRPNFGGGYGIYEGNSNC
jgi:hypothetical protein